MEKLDFNKKTKQKKSIKNLNKRFKNIRIKYSKTNILNYIKNSGTNVFTIIISSILLLLLMFTVKSSKSVYFDLAMILEKSVLEDYMMFFTTVIFLAGLALLIILCIPNFSSYKFGKEDEKPEYSFISWFAQVFCAGVGSSFIHSTVYEIFKNMDAPYFTSSTMLDRSVATGIFNRGFSGWAFYLIAAIPMAYYFHDKKLPLAPRSYLYPILKDKIYGKVGSIVDGFTIVVIFLCILNTFVFISVSISTMISDSFNLENGLLTQNFIVFLLLTFLIFAHVLKVDRIIPQFSNALVIVYLIYVLFYFLQGPTVKILSTYITVSKIYTINSGEIVLNLANYKNMHLDYVANESIYLFALWISWSSFMGLFIAKISRGRTVLECLFGIVIIPVFITLLNYSVFAILSEEIIINGSYVIQDFIDAGSTAIPLINEIIITDNFLNLYLYFIFIFLIISLTVTTISAAHASTDNIIKNDLSKVSIFQKVVSLLILGAFTKALISFGAIKAIHYIEAIVVILSIPIIIGLVIYFILFLYQVLDDVLYEKIYKETLGYRYDALTMLSINLDENYNITEDISTLKFGESDNIINK